MIEQVIEKPDTEVVTRQRWLTPQEIEQITQPCHEESMAELSAYWKNRFEERRRKEETAE